tara:strand:+ start:101 stop:574 length:474 start_codon:yes stop_codon:yes gene_type:complete
MINLKTYPLIAISILIGTMLLVTPLNAYSIQSTQRMISTIDSPYDILMQYQIRDSSKNLICVVESSIISYYDSSLTRNYLDNHTNHKIIEKNDQSMNYVLIKDSWTQGEGDSFLSAVKHIIREENTGSLITYFFANTNGCAVQPGDLVTVYWKILYL